jgi:hypothetical protein
MIITTVASIVKEDIVREAIDYQSRYVKQTEENLNNFVALDDKGNANQTFWHLIQSRVLLNEMIAYAESAGISY